MDLAEIRFIRKVFIKERGMEVFMNNPPSPILWEPCKDSSPPCTAVGNPETNVHTVLSAAFYLLLVHTVGNGAMNKFGTLYR